MSKDMTDAELVEKVAREVLELLEMNGKYCFQSNAVPSGMKIWNPLTDANDTQMIKNRLREMGWTIDLYIEPNGETEVTLFHNATRTEICEMADTEARAICEAAIKAVEGK
jgi:translation elongation factor EF-Tu-like GTPase